MRWSDAFIVTLREDPAECEAVSHKLMVRAGLVNKLMAGAYSYLPLGYKVLNKAVNIVREEMNKAGAQEVLLPAIHPSELWARTGRDQLLDDIFMSHTTAAGARIIFGPTHEEVITDLVSKFVKSYRQLPLNLYQIQTKFRYEPRPRFGVIRSREFIMKDAYSFNTSEEDLQKSYEIMRRTYCAIFDRCGIPYKVVEASSGAMGGSVSNEFMVISPNGEDRICVCTSCGYAANLECSPCETQMNTDKTGSDKQLAIEEVKTPGKTTIEDVSKFMKVQPAQLVKTLIYVADGEPVAVLIRGDYELNDLKLAVFLGASNVEMADEETVKKITGCEVGFAGPVGIGIKIVADNSVKDLKDFIAGANKNNTHYKNVNSGRDFKAAAFTDIRFITENDICPKCGKNIELKNAIEIGHIFKLGTKYSKDLGAKFLDENGKEQTIIMGCYGIGVNRIAAASIEVSHDDDGIIWPVAIAPYEVAVLPLNYEDADIKSCADKIYEDLAAAGVDVILDDRDARAGAKFKDADLIGFPMRVVIGAKSLKEGKIELQTRRDKSKEMIAVDKALEAVQAMLEAL